MLSCAPVVTCVGLLLFCKPFASAGYVLGPAGYWLAASVMSRMSA